MRGNDDRGAGLFSYVRLEDRIAADHPLRAIRALVEEVLERLSGRLAGLYSHTGRSSIPPEQLLKATLLQAFFSVRSERQLMEQIDYKTPRAFPRTATGCSRRMWCASSWQRCSGWAGSSGCSRPIIFRSMAP
jgi:hypothetical protein